MTNLMSGNIYNNNFGLINPNALRETSTDNPPYFDSVISNFPNKAILTSFMMPQLNGGDKKTNFRCLFSGILLPTLKK